ncbi:hypothetical protein [Moorena producens]|uniref:hypothetical protein n=1 Tax=Moorena producens TaxID=1155739 RepID=UPI0013145734|nr:hypothetical protein [Moorena producens]
MGASPKSCLTLPAPCSLLPAPCSLLPKTQDLNSRPTIYKRLRIASTMFRVR